MAGLLDYAQDSRFHKISSSVSPVSLSENKWRLPFSQTLHAENNQADYDPYMEKYGTKLTKLSTEDSKKFRQIEYMPEFNPFIACRMIFGTNWRADVAAVLAVRETSPYQIANILGCSCETAHRNHASLKAAGWPRIKIPKFR